MNKLNINTKNKLVALTIIFCLIVLFIFFLGNGFSKVLKEKVEMSYEKNGEYISLFQDSVKFDFKYWVTYLITNRPAISNFNYQNDYCITVYKILLTKDIQIPDLLKEEYESTIGETTDVHFSYNLDCCSINYKSGEIAPISEIYLRFGDNHTKTILKNDSVAFYYIRNNEFSLRYGKDSTEDLFTSKIENSFLRKSSSKSVLFIKRNNFIYFLLMSVNDKNGVLPQDLLYQLINKKGN